MLYSSLLANPDDPQVHRPLHGPHGPLPGPREPGSPGRTAIVQGQVFTVGAMLIAQFWLVTDALFSRRRRHRTRSSAGMVIAGALVAWLWPRHRTPVF